MNDIYEIRRHWTITETSVQDAREIGSLPARQVEWTYSFDTIEAAIEKLAEKAASR